MIWCSDHNNEQHGFHKNNSCEAQLLETANELSTFQNLGQKPWTKCLIYTS